MSSITMDSRTVTVVSRATWRATRPSRIPRNERHSLQKVLHVEDLNNPRHIPHGNPELFAILDVKLDIANVHAVRIF